MEIVKPGTNLDFVGKQKIFLLLSAVMVLVSLGLIAVFGLNFGVDFEGGSEIVLKFEKTVNVGDVRKAMDDMGFDHPDVQEFGSADENRFLVRVSRSSVLNPENTGTLQAAIAKGVGEIERFNWSEAGGDVVYVKFKDGKVDIAKLQTVADAAQLGKFEVEARGSEERPEYQLVVQELQSTVAARLAERFGVDTFDAVKGVERVETVGPRVGQQLREDGMVSMLLALLFILIYIAFRFDGRYAPGAVLALFHDVIITLGVFAALQTEVSLPILAALLSIIGYSLNDTIVIFDRIRENLGAMASDDVSHVVNVSINDSLSRTLLTSLTTLLAVIALYFFGGGLVKNFALALIIGIVVGTYSSSFIASPIMIAMHNWREQRRKDQEARAAQAPKDEHAEPL